MKNKRIISLIIAIMMCLFTTNTIIAGITDQEEGGEIVRKTTTIYHTTIMLAGKYIVPETGEVYDYNITMSEKDGNIDDEIVMQDIEYVKAQFMEFAEQCGATQINISDPEILDYYYDVHDEITQEMPSDTILIGDIDDIFNYGTIVINTILDKHQKYIINATATTAIKGDLDKNNVVDANDASIALEIFKAENATAEDITIGDMDGNNLIDANDASLILELYKTNN